jgi:anaerobic selenocysteine-containing dehydrogenase
MAHQTRSEVELPAGVEVKPTVCFWCKAECGLLAYVKV